MRSLYVAGALLGVLLTTFLVVDAIGITLLEDPQTALGEGGAYGAVVAVALLVADALLPIPASVVMIALGALYGPVLGIALAVAGRFGMALLGFAIGRRGGTLLARAIPDERERAHAEALVHRWGALALIVSRPVPLLAETVVLVAGAARLPWRVACTAALLGSLPEAIVYALVGTAAATFENAALIWLGFLVVALAFRLIERRQRVSSQTMSATTSASSTTAGT